MVVLLCAWPFTIPDLALPPWLRSIAYVLILISIGLLVLQALYRERPNVSNVLLGAFAYTLGLGITGLVAYVLTRLPVGLSHNSLTVAVAVLVLILVCVLKVRRPIWVWFPGGLPGESVQSTVAIVGGALLMVTGVITGVIPTELTQTRHATEFYVTGTDGRFDSVGQISSDGSLELIVHIRLVEPEVQQIKLVLEDAEQKLTIITVPVLAIQKQSIRYHLRLTKDQLDQLGLRLWLSLEVNDQVLRKLAIPNSQSLLGSR